MKKYDLLLEIHLNTDLTNKEEVQNHLKEYEKPYEDWLDETHDAVDAAIECVWESATERFYSYLDRWYENDCYVDHAIPEGMDAEQFAKLVMRQVRNRLHGVNT